MSYGEISNMEGCGSCCCCTLCQVSCSGSCGNEKKETDDDVVCRILNIDPNCAAIRSAAEYRRRFEEETEALFRDAGDVNDIGDDPLGDYVDYSEGSGSEGGDSDAGLE